MSDVGLFLLLFAALLLLVGVIRFLAWLTELQEEYGSLPRAITSAVQQYVIVRPVKSSQAIADSISRENERTTRTDRTDDADELVSVADQWLDRLEVDRTKRALIELTVYSGWTVAEIRTAIKGENAALGAEIEAAKKRLGMEAATYRTPVAGRATDASYYPEQSLKAD